MESLFIQVHLLTKPKATELLLASVYRPPSAKVDFWDNLCYEIENVTAKNDNFVLLGDLNTNVLQHPPSHHYEHLRRLCSELCVKNIITTPTRQPSGTCLDLILVNNVVPHNPPIVHSIGDATDHFLVQTVLPFQLPQPPPTHRVAYVRKPPLSKADYSLCTKDLSERLASKQDIQLKADHLSESMVSVISKHAPMRPVTVPNCKKPTPQPWITPELQKLLQRRSHLHKKLGAKRDDPQLLQSYRAVRREGTILNGKLKSQYCMKQFTALKNNPKGQWSLLNGLAGRKCVRRLPKATLNELTTTFANVVHDPTRPNIISLPPDDDLQTPVFDHFEPICPTIIEYLLKTLNTHKAAGSDGVHPCFLKHCRQAIVDPLTDVVNESLRTGAVPTCYKYAHVCPLMKSGDPFLASNYRPISLLPVASKISRRTPTDLVLRKFQLYSLEQRLNLNFYVLVYRSVYLLTSPLLSQLFVTRAAGRRSVSTTRGQSSLALELPSTKSRYGLHAVSFLDADRWNSLPSSCRQARSAAEFASLVKRYLGYPVKRHCL